MKRIVVALALLGASLPTVPPNKAQVVFYRSDAVMSMARDCNVKDGGTSLGSLSTNTYSVKNIDIEPHRFVARGEPVIINPKAGETYYIECTMVVSLIGWRAHLHPSTESDFKSKVGKLTWIG